MRSSIPILLDGDTGYGNFNSVRRLVRKLCQRSVAAVCLEDKLFPKTNSFPGRSPAACRHGRVLRQDQGRQGQPDRSALQHCGQNGGPDRRPGLGEALRRAEAYHAAGADAILIHSKAKTADEVLAFAAEWGGRCPLVLVPTTYCKTPTQRFREAGISMVIWANHNLRATLGAMRMVSRRIKEEESLIGVEDEIASIQDVFALTGEQELAEAERRYLPARGSGTGKA